MSLKYLTNIDLNKNELQNAKLQNLATAPSSPVKGQMYFDTASNKAMVYNGSAWVPWEADTNTVTGVKGNSESSYRTGNVNITAANVGAVPTTRKVNGHALSGDVTVTASDVGLGSVTDGAEINQNAFSNVKVGSTTVAADSKTDTLELVAGSNVTLTPDATNDKVTIAATDTTYSDATTSAHGLMSTTDKSKLDGIASGAEVNQNAFSNVKVGSSTVAADSKTDTLELVAGSNVTLTPDTTNDKVTIAATDTTYSAGTEAQLEAGSDTTNRVWTPKIIHDYVTGVAGAVDAMRFKGTIGTGGDVTTLPTSGVKVGDTYRVITAGTYASQTCEVGDLIIATATTPTWTVAQTNIDGAITGISGTAPISVSGSGSSRTVSISEASTSAAGAMSSSDKTKLNGIETGAQKNPTYTAFTGKPTANQTPGFGSTFTISQISQSTAGQVSGTDRTVKIPNTEATTSSAGLMSATDKQILTDMASQLPDLCIDGITLSDIDGMTDEFSNVSRYAECSTSAGTATKAITISDRISLTAGLIVAVKFANTNTAAVANLALQVNGGTAKPIKYRGSNLPSAGTLAAGRVYWFVYDGTNFELMGDLDTDTNTLNTAGSTDSSSKLFLIGATSQAANPQTYSQDTVYAGTDGHVYSNGKQAVNLSDTQALTNKTYNGYTLGAACAKGVTTEIAGHTSSADLPTTAAVVAEIIRELQLAFGAYKYTATNPALTVSGGLCTWTVTHNLGKEKVIAQLYEVSTGNQIMAEIATVDTNSLTVKMISDANIAAGTYRICVEAIAS